MFSRALALFVIGFAGLAAAAPCTELPLLFIIQDKSGSMSAVPDPVNAPTAPSKWSTARTVVPQVAAQFSNRFRFGVMMYPELSSTFNCTTGTTVAGVPSTAAQVNNIYQASASGGGTPTATSLVQAKNYLLGLGLTAPAHVLLITDGLPNCNLSNNAASCQTTTAGCQNTNTCSGASCCSLGAKDCLDDNATVAAAAALKNAGIKVYVVGFGASVTSANDKTVLDAIAAAGGTGSAYAANSSAALTSTLNTIASSTATCCINACTNGAALCNAQGQRQACTLDAATGCTNWTTTNCAPMSQCMGGACQACTNACASGALRCSGSTAQSCQVQANGCTAWATTRDCGYGEVCAGGQCNSCQACSINASRCTATGVESCDWNVVSGCTQWKAAVCATGTRCTGNSCVSCTSACTAGAKRCAGTTVESCVADGQGCTAWQAGQQCTSFCSGGACGVCGTTCTVGSGRCNGNNPESCATDANACTVWTAQQPCGAGTTCTNGLCQACAVSCSPGTKRCGASGGLEECQAQATGCQALVVAGACAAGETCQGGVCIPPCQNECTLGAGKCVAGAPSVCETAPTGCTVWKTRPGCAVDAVCLEGNCRTSCAGIELESCPNGEECTGLATGERLCLPKGVVDAGTAMQPPKKVPVDDPETGDMKIRTVSSGCGCSTGAEGAAAWMLLAALGLLRTRTRLRARG